jgi:hypothetical protein
VEQAFGAFPYLSPGQYLSVNVSPATILSERLEPLIAFAGRSGSVIVAEGIERPEERLTLCELGIAYGQGWLFSRAMPLVAAQQWLLGAATCDDRADTMIAARPPAPAARSRGVGA